MYNSAFLLDKEFISDLWNRINTSGNTAMPFEGLDSLAPQGQPPSREHLAALLDAVFWTSYEKEEGMPVSVSLIFRKPEQASDTFCFDRPIPLTPKNLVKLGPALENPRAHITVWPDDDDSLLIWGFRTGSDDFITYDLWIQGLGPGCVLITFGGKSLAALTGSRGVFLNPGILMQAVRPKISSPETHSNRLQAILRYNSLLFIAQAMRAHGHGGTVLVVPEGSDWQKSIRHPVHYTGGASFLDTIPDGMPPAPALPMTKKWIVDYLKKTFAKKEEKSAVVRKKIRQQCSRIARLTAVDGALVMSLDRYTYCFGAKILAIDPVPSEYQVQVLRPIEGFAQTPLNFSDLGGTRHQSAAQFAYEQPQTIAIVASQDGDVTFFTRDDRSGGLLAIQQAELALLHEGLSGALWNISLFSEMDSP